MQRRSFLSYAALASLLTATPRQARAGGAQAAAPRVGARRPIPKPGPMVPPVPAIITSVHGKPGDPDELSVLWTFVVNGDPPQVGVAAGDEHIAGGLITLHREFALNVPVASMIHAFDRLDFNSSRAADKYALSGLTRGTATAVKAPTVNEAPIQLECRVSHILRVPPVRTVFIADVVATTVHEGICDDDGRLRPESAAFFGMMAGCGEFFTMDRKVGHIGQSVGRNDIRY
ncbi:MAG: flavin reductase family protein [Vicinamibacterales bacterium]